jgi:hypothetical protein
MVSDQSNTALLPHKPVLFIGEGGAGGCFLFEAMVVVMGFWVWKFSPKSDSRCRELGCSLNLLRLK